MPLKSAKKLHKKAQAGFGLTWITAIIIVLLVSMIIGLTKTTMLLDDKHRITQRNMLVIEKALAAYVLKNKSLPCPAPINLTYGEADYSQEERQTYNLKDPCKPGWGDPHPEGETGDPHPEGEGGDPHDKSDRCFKGVFKRSMCNETIDGIMSNDILIIGSVPAKNLNIPIKYAVDGWGNKITYAVDKLYTISYTEDTNISGWKDKISANITVQKGNTTLTNESMYVLVSHGPNGLGAFGEFAINQNSYPGNLYELDNIYRHIGLDSMFNVNAGDDIVVYHTPEYTDNIINKFDNKIDEEVCECPEGDETCTCDDGGADGTGDSTDGTDGTGGSGGESEDFQLF